MWTTSTGFFEFVENVSQLLRWFSFLVCKLERKNIGNVAAFAEMTWYFLATSVHSYKFSSVTSLYTFEFPFISWTCKIIQFNRYLIGLINQGLNVLGKINKDIKSKLKFCFLRSLKFHIGETLQILNMLRAYKNVI